MAATAKRARPVATFRHPVPIEVRRPGFELLASVAQLDVDRLARVARAEFEVGYFRTECCRQLVRAIVRRGMVTKLAADPCADLSRVRMTPELARVLRSARRRVPTGGPPVRYPVPVADFLGSAMALTIRTITCVEICFFGVCIYCCNRPEDPDDWVCGRSVVILDTF